jgi:hypothetical protein
MNESKTNSIVERMENTFTMYSHLLTSTSQRHPLRTLLNNLFDSTRLWNDFILVDITNDQCIRQQVQWTFLRGFPNGKTLLAVTVTTRYRPPSTIKRYDLAASLIILVVRIGFASGSLFFWIRTSEFNPPTWLHHRLSEFQVTHFRYGETW